MRKENYITEKILVTLPVNTGKYLSFDIESNWIPRFTDSAAPKREKLDDRKDKTEFSKKRWNKNYQNLTH